MRSVTRGSQRSPKTLVARQGLTVAVSVLVGCTTEQGTPMPPPPTAPTITLTASPTSVMQGGSATLSWTSNDATACTATGGWSGDRALTGTSATGPLDHTTTFGLSCTGSGGSASDQASVNVVQSPPPTDAVFPLRVESGKRYLVDAQGRPFLIHGDTPWSLIVQLTREEAADYLEDRRLKGFNTVLVNLIEHEFADDPPNTVYGEPPFLTPGDFSTPNEAYFRHAEYVVEVAASKDILVMLTPAYMGFIGGSQGWYQEMVANGPTKLREYGRYLAQRFADHDNILWVHGGDFDPPEKELLRAIVNGIQDEDSRWLHTFHGDRNTSALDYLGTSEPWLTVNDIYTGAGNVVSSALTEYVRSTLPFFLIEAIYEGEGASEAVVRQQAYQAVLSGASGQLMGNRPIWPFDTGWEQALDSEGARTLTHLRNLMTGLDWATLVPDAAGSVVTAGVGTGGIRTATAVAADGSFGLVYLPGVRDITVDLTAFTGTSIRAQWYDPSNGSLSPVAGSPFPTAQQQSFRPTGANAHGYDDWVLVLNPP